MLRESYRERLAKRYRREKRILFFDLIVVALFFYIFSSLFFYKTELEILNEAYDKSMIIKDKNKP